MIADSGATVLADLAAQTYGDDTSLTFHDTPLSSLLILLVYVSKFNVHDTLMTLPLRLASVALLLPCSPSFNKLQILFVFFMYH